MAWTLVSSTSAAGTTELVTTSSIDTTGANLLVIGLSYNTGAAPNIWDNKGNVWTALTARAVAANGTSRLYYCFNPRVGSGHTFTNSGASNFSTVCVAAFNGNMGPSYDKENGATTASAATIQPGSTTPTNNNSLLVSHFMFSAAGTASIDSSYTISNQTNFGGGVNYGGALAYLVQTTAAASNPTWTSGGGATALATNIAVFNVGITVGSAWLKA